MLCASLMEHWPPLSMSISFKSLPSSLAVCAGSTFRPCFNWRVVSRSLGHRLGASPPRRTRGRDGTMRRVRGDTFARLRSRAPAFRAQMEATCPQHAIRLTAPRWLGASSEKRDGCTSRSAAKCHHIGSLGRLKGPTLLSQIIFLANLWRAKKALFLYACAVD